MSDLSAPRTSNHGLPLSAWPQVDRDAWLNGTRAGRGPFRRNGGGKTLSEATYRKRAEGYGVWLWFLGTYDLLDAGQRPEERVTLDHLDVYLEHLIASGVADHTIVGRFEELRGAIQTICPGRDFSHVTNPLGVSIRRLLPMTRKTLFIPDVLTTLKWAEDLFEEALTLPGPDRRLQVRDAAIIGVLADRAPRLRALSSLRLGTHLRHVGGEWLLLQDEPIMKMQNILELPIGARMGVILDRYIHVEREELLRSPRHDSLWVTNKGSKLDRTGIQRAVRMRSTRRFGQAVSPHRFRASLATTQALLNSDSPLDASAILGHSPEIALKHYNRATAMATSRRHDEYLTQLISDAPEEYCPDDEEAGEFDLDPPKLPRNMRRRRIDATKVDKSNNLLKNINIFE